MNINAATWAARWVGSANIAPVTAAPIPSVTVKIAFTCRDFRVAMALVSAAVDAFAVIDVGDAALNQNSEPSVNTSKLEFTSLVAASIAQYGIQPETTGCGF